MPRIIQKVRSFGGLALYPDRALLSLRPLWPPVQSPLGGLL
jgi:hypothetical protein